MPYVFVEPRCCFTSTETVGLLGRAGSGPGRPPPLPHQLLSSVPQLRRAALASATTNKKRQSGDDHRAGFQARSKDLRGGRWSWTLNYAQKRSWVRRWRWAEQWAEQVGRLLLRVVQVIRQQRCNGHCLSGSVQHSSWKSNCAVHKSLGNGEGTPP